MSAARVCLLCLAVLGLSLAEVFRRPSAGIFFRVSEKGSDYISSLVSDALPQLLEGLSLPRVKVSQATISNILVREFARPHISAKFDVHKGVVAHVRLPSVRVAAHLAINFLFYTSEDDMVLHIHNMSLDMHVAFSHNETLDVNRIEIPLCQLSHDEVFVTFSTNELNSFKEVIEGQIVAAVASQVCDTSREAVRFLELQELQQSSPSPTNASVEEETAGEGGLAEYGRHLGRGLCQPPRADDLEEVPWTDEFLPLNSTVEEESTTTATPEEGDNSTTGSWSVDLSLRHLPHFTDHDVVFGLDGGVLLDGLPSENVSRVNQVNISSLHGKMVGILISEYVPNTLLAHIFSAGLGHFAKKYDHEHLPKPLKTVGKLLCSKCFLEIKANLTERPLVNIDDKLGARVALTGDVAVVFEGRQGKVYELLTASLRLHVTLKPFLRHSRLYGHVSLTNVDVNVNEMALGGSLAGAIRRAAAFLVPRSLWPQVKKRLRFALNRRGVELPVLCGVKLHNVSLSYVDHAAVLNTDFSFNLPHFIRVFKEYNEKRVGGLRYL